MTLPQHEATTITPAVVAMRAWMEDTSLKKREDINNYLESESSHTKERARSVLDHKEET